ncbi:MAG: hypothetical protein HQK91_07925 [Nitrospirae bacterium]|nr:hypothetical protein [Nitrospirota bacterium]MBF0541362.1 hypothetical protein [Nitrospirota bacterium]
MSQKILKRIDKGTISQKSSHKVYFGPFQFEIDLDLQKSEIELTCKFLNMMAFDCKFDKKEIKFQRTMNLIIFSCLFDCDADFDKECQLRCTITPCFLKVLCKKINLILIKW